MSDFLTMPGYLIRRAHTRIRSRSGRRAVKMVVAAQEALEANL